MNVYEESDLEQF